MEPGKITEIILGDEEYLKLQGRYIEIFTLLINSLPKRKRRLLGEFAEVSEKIVFRRYKLLVDETIEEVVRKYDE